VENVAITAGIPMPKVYLIEDSAPNAFATGRDPQHASVAFTTGIIQLLKNEELEGVVAHELSHIKNYDTRLMTVVIVCVGIVSIMAQIFFRIGGLGGNRKNNQLGLIFFLLGIILLIFSPLIAKLIQLAISRKREFLADASGVLLTRFPDGLARALEKIDQAAQPMQHADGATAHLFIANPFGKKRRWTNLFSTHPPIADRVAALRTMA
jgi:heat shock protein HtpX